MKDKIGVLPHPVQKARAVEYVLENTKIDVNESDYFPGIYSLNRLVNAITQNVWSAGIFGEILPRTGEVRQRTFST